MLWSCGTCIDKLEGAAETGGEFVAEQAPLVIQEYLVWYFWSNVLEACAGMALIILAVVIAVVCWRNFKAWFVCNKYGWVEPWIAVPVIVCAVMCVFGALPICLGIHDAVKVSVAPRVVLIEKAAELAK